MLPVIPAKFGTKRNARIELVDLDRATIVVSDDADEVRIIIEKKPLSPTDLQVGDLGNITWTQGGPYGGHWKFERNDKSSADRRKMLKSIANAIAEYPLQD